MSTTTGNTTITTANDDVYAFLLPFERSYRHEVAYKYFVGLPWYLPFVIVAVYVTAIFLGQRYMRNRKPFQLRGALFLWNAFLAVGTIMSLVRLYPQAVYTARRFGVHYSVCGSLQHDMSQAALFWQLVFILSKVVELADTAFVVLRKKPLYFLHWYHHCTVLLYCWYSYYEQTPSGRLFAYINIVVHSMMYSYYALTSLSFRIPRPVAMVITLVQLSQMVIGCYINYYVYQIHKQKIACGVTVENIRLCLLMYSSYFVLFAWYFYKSYIQPNGTEKKVN